MAVDKNAGNLLDSWQIFFKEIDENQGNLKLILKLYSLSLMEETQTKVWTTSYHVYKTPIIFSLALLEEPFSRKHS